MKKLGFEQQGNSIFLVYELGPEDNVDSMSLGMLINNRIPGFAPAVLVQFDNTKRIKYDVTARVPAAQYLLGTVNKKQILGVFSGIVRAFLSAEDYMIDVRTIQLELSSVFSDVATADTVLLSLPVFNQQTEAAPDLSSFFKNILFSAQYDGRENRDYVAKLMSYLNGAPTFSLSEFKGILDYLMTESTFNEPRPQPQPQEPPTTVGAGSWPAPNAAQTPSTAAPVNDGRPLQVPPMPPPVQRNASASAVPADGGQQSQPEDQISLFYLLQHYNKDNAAKYKAQKEAKKASNAGKKKKEPEPQKKQGSAGFAVPGHAEIPSAPAGEEGYPVPQLQQPAFQSAPVNAAPQAQQPAFQSVQAPVVPVYIAPQAPQHPDQAPLQQPGMSQSAATVIDETLYFSEKDGDETVLLGSETQAQKLNPYLVRKRNNERIPINKAIFRLGRDVEYNDYAVTDNRYIGHGHCHIVIRDGEYFVVDDNSKNHTKVNGSVITPGVEIKIAHGYTICLADEDFEFRLY